MTAMVWFRNDLRLADNPALTAAVKSGDPVEACFAVTPEQWREHDWSPAKVRLLQASLQSLAEDLARLGIPFHIVRADNFADSERKLEDLCRERRISALHFNEEYALNERARDRRLRDRLQQHDVRVHRYRDQSVTPVTAILTQSNTPYTVFTPYARSWRQWLSEHPVSLYAVPKPQADALAPTPVPDLSSYGEAPDTGVAGGERAAWKRLELFTREAIGDYRALRDFPARTGTSQLSPYLALGVLSGRQCLSAAHEAEAGGANSEGVATWINELCWRDFYLQILHHFPHVSRHRAFKREYDGLSWNRDDKALKAWQEGRTGIPIVDAAMRQLNQTGWMHNRLRMVVAMFLSKNLFQDWRAGERYFMRNLVDGYLPSNNGGWQWSASTGTDSAPYFRLFNPVTQAERFDPQGEFIRRYLPELKHLRGKAVFAPWEHGKSPGDYPPPIVDLKRSRREAIERFKAFKNSLE